MVAGVCLNVRMAVLDNQLAINGPGPTAYTQKPAVGPQISSEKPNAPNNVLGKESRSTIAKNSGPGFCKQIGSFGKQVNVLQQVQKSCLNMATATLCVLYRWNLTGKQHPR